jgi:hypothetical protein
LKASEETSAQACPICKSAMVHRPWPYLKGGTGANGETLIWYRCTDCSALFSDLTPVHCQCKHCRIVPHASWCAVHNAPALAEGVCTCDLVQDPKPAQAWLAAEGYKVLAEPADEPTKRSD